MPSAVKLERSFFISVSRLRSRAFVRACSLDDGALKPSVSQIH